MGRGMYTLLYYYIGGDESDGVNGINGVDCGELFFKTGEKVFPNGGEIIRREGRKLKKSKGSIEKKEEAS